MTTHFALFDLGVYAHPRCGCHTAHVSILLGTRFMVEIEKNWIFFAAVNATDGGLALVNVSLASKMASCHPCPLVKAHDALSM